jgi:hypothetical protein
MQGETCISVSSDRQESIDRGDLVCAQLKLLVVRAEQGLPIDPRSVVNLLRVCRELFRGRHDE